MTPEAYPPHRQGDVHDGPRPRWDEIRAFRPKADPPTDKPPVIRAEAPPGTPEEYVQVLSELHDIINYSLQQAIRRNLEVILPEVLPPLIRAELRKAIGR